jgi:hypothetical protein
MTDEILQQEPAPIGPFFRFPDEATWLTAARDAGFMVADEEGVEQLAAYTKDRAIDVVGTITRGGEWDEDGNEITAPTVLDGWHVNYRGEVPDGWLQYAVEPQNPVRVWA